MLNLNIKNMKIKHFFSIIVFLFFAFASINAQTKTEVTSTEVNTMLQKESKLIVLDVRTPAEFASGHIKGAINIDVHQPDALDQINKLDRNAKYIVYCRTKNRSGVIVNHMLQNGFKNIFQMMDGMVGWNQNNLPVIK
jgi:rhodanese-related sulfurtransferase